MSADPNDLHPLARAKLNELYVAARDRLGILLDLVETWRDGSAQAAALAAGASNKGPGQSWHNVTYSTGKPASFAFHVDPFPGPPILGYGAKLIEWPGAARVGIEMKPGRLRPCTAAEALLTSVGLLGEELGLTWGGRWDSPMDWLHFELHPDGGTLAQVLAVMKSMGDVPAAPRAEWRT